MLPDMETKAEFKLPGFPLSSRLEAAEQAHQLGFQVPEAAVPG